MDLKPQYIKKLKSEFELINFFENFKNKPYYFYEDNIKNIFYKEGKKYILELSKGIRVERSKLRFQNINDKIINIEDHELEFLNSNIKLKILKSNIKSSNFYDNTSFKIDCFCEEGFDKGGDFYCRLIIPYSKKIDIEYRDFFSNFSFMVHINNQFFRGIEFKIKDFTFQVYHLDNYFIVESINKIKFDLFDKYARNILATFGFFTGFAPMEIGYFFIYEEFNGRFKKFLYNSNFIDTYQSTSLISLIVYDYYPNDEFYFDYENGFIDDERIKNIKGKLKPIKREHFEKVLKEINDNQEFSSIIYTYLNISNSNNKMELNIKCACYAVLLEMITNFISHKNKDKMYFIDDKKVRKKLQDKLINVAKNIFDEFNLKNFEASPIKKRIDNINSPTNRDKLFKPFEILNISLSENERKIIEKRNDFLHGENPVKELDISEQSKKLFYISLELNYLVVSLILKYIGYDGIVKNLSKIYLDTFNLPELKNEKNYKELSNNNNN